jgi:hypothetical protein
MSQDRDRRTWNRQRHDRSMRVAVDREGLPFFEMPLASSSICRTKIGMAGPAVEYNSTE